MGFGDVIASEHPEVALGERVFGFFPMSKHLVIQADRLNAGGFSDAAPHRSKHAPAYRQYSRVATDPQYDAEYEDETLLLRGLFMTSFLVDDFLADGDFFGARSFLISSASSKTAVALAALLSARGGTGDRPDLRAQPQLRRGPGLLRPSSSRRARSRNAARSGDPRSCRSASAAPGGASATTAAGGCGWCAATGPTRSSACTARSSRAAPGPTKGTSSRSGRADSLLSSNFVYTPRMIASH